MVRILLVDNDPPCLRALAQRLRFVFGYRTLWVDETEYASEALILASAHHYDILIVDVVMPGRKGVKLIEQLARLQPGVPIVLTGSVEGERWEAEVRRLGLTAFLRKPIDFHMLVQGLTSVLSAQVGLRRHRKVNAVRETLSLIHI